MPGLEKITILLADEDAIRCEGLAAVLRQTPQFEILAICCDGEAAIDQIRRLRPHVAVVDLNLTKVHGIELVRRVRSEGLATKVIILSGTNDEDLIRQVVSAGGAGYLLKNGPARHLIDAVSYVQDGGQYFSPQLRGGGLNAESLRPILDRLEEIERRLGDIEKGAVMVLDNTRGRQGDRPGDRSRDSRAAIATSLPELVEAAVANRFAGMTGRLQEKIEEAHVETLETFVRNIQARLVQRVSALETDIGNQSEELGQLRGYSQRTEDNLSRLIAGVDKLAQELPKRLQGSASQARSSPAPQPRRPKSSLRSGAGRFSIAILFIICAFVAVRFFDRSKAAAPAPGIAVLATYADTNTKMVAARHYTEKKDYPVAETIYRQVLKSEPNNAEAIKSLASVLYREDKIDESAAVLGRLSPK